MLTAKYFHAQKMSMQLDYLSGTSGIGGRIKERIEDFAVEEVMRDGTVLKVGERIEKNIADENADFVHFVLQKTNWNTLQAIDAVARALHVTKKRFNYAGNKDRRAVTTQLVSAFKMDCARISSVRVKDIQINGCWSAKEKINLGDLQANRFNVVVRGVCENAGEKVEKINNELHGVFPNYFGEQRFGSMRSNTHLVGKAIVQANFKEAVENYLAYSGEGESVEESGKARARLREDWDFKKALEYFPYHLKYERTLLAHLSQHSTDYINALRKLPRGLNLMFVHAYQSFLFNELLSERVKEMKKEGKKKIEAEEGEREEKGKEIGGKTNAGEKENEQCVFVYGKLIGSETTNLSEREKKLFEREGVSVEMFKIPSFPEIGSKGSERLLLAPYENFECVKVEGARADGVANDSVVRLSFTLQAGSYATVLLGEFCDAKETSKSVLNNLKQQY